MQHFCVQSKTFTHILSLVLYAAVIKTCGADCFFWVRSGPNWSCLKVSVDDHQLIKYFALILVIAITNYFNINGFVIQIVHVCWWWYEWCTFIDICWDIPQHGVDNSAFGKSIILLDTPLLCRSTSVYIWSYPLVSQIVLSGVFLR